MTSTALPPVVNRDDAGVLEAMDKEVKAGDAPDSVWQQIGPYLGYVGYFVGAGLISGGIVHYTLAPARYVLVAAAGVVVFLLATLCNEVLLRAAALPRQELMRVVGGSLLLSLGIGMLSGGIQHFSDFPARSAILVPAGLLLSFVAFHVRTAATDLRRAVLGQVGAAVLSLAAVLAVGLDTLADRVAAGDAAGGHAHDATTAVDPAVLDTHGDVAPAGGGRTADAPQGAGPAPAAEHENSHGH